MVTNPKAFYSSIFLLGDLNSVWASGNFPNTRGTELLHLQNVTMLVTCLSHAVALAWQTLQLAYTPYLGCMHPGSNPGNQQPTPAAGSGTQAELHASLSLLVFAVA